ncbi:MAG: vWA domain-containing protein [Pirellulaceae bacterium]
MMLFRQTGNTKKIVYFAAFAAIGCFSAALVLGELLLYLLLPPSVPPPKQQVDVLFVLDVTGSMGDEIQGVQKGIQDFVTTFKSRDLDSAVAIIAFRDKTFGEMPETPVFGGKVFTNDAIAFGTVVGQMMPTGGRDEPESSLDALALAAQQPFREDAIKIILLISDAPPKIPDRDIPSVAIAAEKLRLAKIDQLHLVIPDQLMSTYSGLRTAAPGQVFSLADTAAGRTGFDSVLLNIGEKIIEMIPVSPIASRTSADTRWLGPILATGTWSGVIAMGASLFLIAAQNHYLRKRPLLPRHDALLGGTGSFVFGLIAGTVGLILFRVFVDYVGASAADSIGRIIAWTILGGLLGLGLSLFVPNLQLLRGLQGGLAGGVAGAIAFLLVGLVLGDVLARLVGAALLGLCIGAMIALVEAVFREAWLEIHYGNNEQRNVTLGKHPVAIGSDAKACTVFTQGVADIVLRYTLQEGRITCEDVTSGQSDDVMPGDTRQVGNLSVVVCGPQVSAATPIQAGKPWKAKSGKGGRLPAPGATAGVDVDFILRIRGREILTSRGIRLTSAEVSGLETTEADGAVAQVSAHPTDPQILGLQNLSTRAWSATLPNGKKKQIAPGRNVRLAIGTKINFGILNGEIEEM